MERTNKLGSFVYSRQRRNDLEIVVSILANIKEDGTKPTHLSNKSMLDYKVMKKYLSYLIQEELVKQLDGKIHITEKGREFLEEYKRLRNLIQFSTNKTA
ncbi:transcriptional regulator [Fervidicoccus fontis]|uniref:Transcriptional regulator n=1 Tax=Fervidicoccus fontis TaxID=683846 RepID=A0A843A6U1_9CREN|nr:winged helix-turn-helix domain-containing protein [Fervidicoccus fontis]MBE9390503.1 transcriptional regulator [Fervidicoccus fontis]